jgi:hypothetical protein
MSSHHKLTESEDYVYGAEPIIYGRLGIQQESVKQTRQDRQGKATPYPSL